MQTSALPTPLQQLDSRPFSFYPPILNVRHNEWIFRRATWSEIVVVNRRSGEEACIPRTFIGDVSITDHPVVVVGLRRELEWKQGAVFPHRRPVIEFPLAANGGKPCQNHPERLAPVVNIRLEQQPEKRAGRKIAVAIMLGAVVCLLAADFARQIQMHQRATVGGRPWEQLTSGDDYYSAVRKLGAPASDRLFSAAGGRIYRTLGYPARNFTLVLMGPDNSELRYAGSVDRQGRVVDSKTPLLRSLHRF